MSLSRRVFLPVGIVILLLVSGCGSNAGNGAASPSPTPPADSVWLHVGATSYQQENTITVTIRNQSKQTISFADHQTNCTALLLEQQHATSWKSLAPCKLMTKTRLLSLKAGETLEVTLHAPGHWPAGLYRARLDYQMGQMPEAGTSHTAYSSTFPVS